ncbi:P-loop containing nucleoside triphosphate hydrolase protein [Suillus occidentalis]|nr:P-loop containing nucleoside triphosphate hydrolase protein [Suillus occidentalis]
MLLTLIACTGLPMPPDRMPTGHYVHVSTPYGQYNTVKAATVGSSVSWNQTITIHERPQTLSKWLMSIFKSKTVHLEIRALYDLGPTLDQYEVVCAFDMTFEQLFAGDGQHKALISDVNNQHISLQLKAGGTNESIVDGQPAHSAAVVQSPEGPASSSKREAKNVVIFGETGSGKSSIINVIAQKQVAATSNDAVGCTSKPKRYSVDISGQKFVLFDTAGLNEGTAGTVPLRQARRQLKNLLDKLLNHKSQSGGVDLIVYCVRNTTAPRIIIDAYDTVYSGICRKKGVPIVVVVTGLESESPMESWWDSHKDKFSSLHLAGHACVTTIQDYPGIPEEHTRRVAQSGEILRDLVLNKCSAVAVDDSFSAGKWCWSPSPSMD